MRRSLAILTLPLALLLPACTEEEDPCSPDNQKASLLEVVASWYLYPELVPAVDPGLYAGTAELLDALTANARAAGKDRGWSHVTTLGEQQQFYAEGTSVGFGFGYLVRGSQLFVSQVFPGSAADQQGFVRGDEITAIGNDPSSMVPAADLVAAGTVGEAIGPSTPGVSRTFDVVPRGGGTAQRIMTKGTFDLDPVRFSFIDRDSNGTTETGYLLLRTFITPANAKLRQAFAAFKAAGVTDVIVDVRYNGGGLLDTAELLADLLGLGLGPSTNPQVMFSWRNNSLHQALDLQIPFTDQPESMNPGRIAFVVTGASASASELVPNVLEPYEGASLALVGAHTYGKPVGQRVFVSERCDLALYLVSLHLVNAQDEGGYFTGLPTASFTGCGILADDDLTRELGDKLESSTAAALAWLDPAATCPATMTPLVSRPADRYPEAPAPTEAQRHVPGLF